MTEQSWLQPERSDSEWRDLGFSGDGLRKLRRGFEEQFSDDLHPGAQVDGRGNPRGGLGEHFSDALPPGAEAAVHRHGQFVVEMGAGVARRDPAQPVTPDTVFVLLSATKAWAAVSAHQLAEQGKLDYD